MTWEEIAESLGYNVIISNNSNHPVSYKVSDDLESVHIQCRCGYETTLVVKPMLREEFENIILAKHDMEPVLRRAQPIPFPILEWTR